MEPHTIGHDWVDGPDRRGIAICHEVIGNGPHGYCQLVDTDEIAANARLIASAPDLLEALKWFIDDLSSPHTVMLDFDANVVRARAAIARATGEA
jgi:hypothetical protein